VSENKLDDKPEDDSLLSDTYMHFRLSEISQTWKCDLK